MKEYALDLWQRAVEALNAARRLIGVSSDNAASRAYYAAFFAATALFALEDRTFTKHTAVRAAIHRDLVKAGRWPVERGKDFSRLMSLRAWGDYGGSRHISYEEAIESIERAEHIVEQVHNEHPEFFPMGVSDDTGASSNKG